MYLAVGLLVGPSLFGCSDEPAAEAAALERDTAVAVTIATAQGVEVPNTLELDGTLRAKRSASLSPLVGGHVSEVLVERGDVVKEGQILMRLRASEYKLAAQAASARASAQLEQLGVERGEAGNVDPDRIAAVAAAKATWEANRDQQARNAQLHSMGAISDQVLEQSRAAEAASRANYESARQGVGASLASYSALSAEAARLRNDADNTRIRAPFAGSIVMRSAEVGEFVSPQAPIVEIVDASELRLELKVPERNAGQIVVGQPVHITVDGTDEEITGTVQFVSAALDVATRTLTVEAVVANPEGRLRAGHFARARIALAGTQQLVQIPTNAIRERAGVERIFVIEDGVARARMVTTLRTTGDSSLISGEIDANETVVIDPPRELGDGVAVLTDNQQPAES